MPEVAPLILLVEDDRLIRETTHDLLELSGFRVLTAPSGRAACALLERNQVDLVVTDLLMPDGDGAWLLERMNPKPGRRPIPVILLTAHADTTPRAEEAKARADAYLVKPFDPDLLIETVRRRLERESPRPGVTIP